MFQDLYLCAYTRFATISLRVIHVVATSFLLYRHYILFWTKITLLWCTTQFTRMKYPLHSRVQFTRNYHSFWKSLNDTEHLFSNNLNQTFLILKCKCWLIRTAESGLALFHGQYHLFRLLTFVVRSMSQSISLCWTSNVVLERKLLFKSFVSGKATAVAIAQNFASCKGLPLKLWLLLPTRNP